MACPKLKYLNIEGCHDVLDFESDSESGIPQPEWETEEEDSGDEDEIDYEIEVISGSDYDYDSINTEEDEDDYSGYSSGEENEQIASESLIDIDSDVNHEKH